MTNLLPPQAKKRLLYEYYLRTTSVFLILSAIAIAVLVVLFSPSFLFLILQETSIETEVGTASTEIEEVNQATAAIREANFLAQLYTTQSEHDLNSTYIDKIKELASNDIRLTAISLTRGEAIEVDNINFTAVANTRQQLIVFLDKLSDSDVFGEFSFPISDLSQSNNIEFTLSVPIIQNSI